MADDNQEKRSGSGGDAWNEFNELTLSVMANRNKYDKCKKSLANTSDAQNEAFQKEKMYYKDRILNMTRGLFHERCENDEINRAHQEYLKSCIEYLKWNDITDMIGEDTRNEIIPDDDDMNHARSELYKKIQSTATNDDDDDDRPQSPSQSPSPSPPPVPPPLSSIMSIANKMCIRRKTIDDFIVLKPSDEHIKARLPKLRDYHGEIMKRVSTTTTVIETE
jgi:hypothetical protein